MMFRVQTLDKSGIMRQLSETYGVDVEHAALVMKMLDELSEREKDLAKAEENERQWLHMPRCNGNTSVQADGRMYVTHSTGESCPLHGEPKTSKRRIRSYVGTKPDRQREATEAINNYHAWREAAQQKRRAAESLRRMITDMYQVGARQQPFTR
jgi:hypothetical protein